jgi:hypothetical protein
MTHDWVNNTRVSVLERDKQVTFEEAVKKRFMYYYDLVDVMSERVSSAHPKASTDTMNMRGTNDDNDDSSSYSSISVTGKDEEEDDGVSAADK